MHSSRKSSSKIWTGAIFGEEGERELNLKPEKPPTTFHFWLLPQGFINKSLLISANLHYQLEPAGVVYSQKYK